MEECLQILDDAKELPNDQILVQQVRLQLLIERKAGGAFNHGANISTEIELHSQLQDIKLQVLAQQQIDRKLLFASCFFNLIDVRIEAALLHLYGAELEMGLSPTSFNATQLTVQQRKSLEAILESIKSWFDVFFTIPPTAYVGLPFSVCTQQTRCIVTLCRLTTLEDQSWNEIGAWKTANALSILDRVIDNLEQVPIVAGLDNSESPEGDTFTGAARMFRALRPGLEAKLGPVELSAASDQQNFDDTFPLDAFAVDGFENDWLMDFLFSPSYNGT